MILALGHLVEHLLSTLHGCILMYIFNIMYRTYNPRYISMHNRIGLKTKRAHPFLFICAIHNSFYFDLLPFISVIPPNSIIFDTTKAHIRCCLFRFPYTFMYSIICEDLISNNNTVETTLLKTK